MTADLVASARTVREHAYAPYSGYRVGCALRTSTGAVFVGTNFENVSFGATICAERAAIAAMVSAGERHIAEMALVTRDGAFPCGICLQVIQEFCVDPERLTVTVVSEDGDERQVSLSDLLPHGFQSGQVHRTD